MTKPGVRRMEDLAVLRSTPPSARCTLSTNQPEQQHGHCANRARRPTLGALTVKFGARSADISDLTIGTITR